MDSRQKGNNPDAQGTLREDKGDAARHAGYIKAEFEGPDIVVYLSNAKEMYKDDSVIRNIASSIKKKLIIRSTAKTRSWSPEKAKAAIERIVPKEATIHNIKFVPEFSEVYIEA